jgi:hypothetical protein
MGNKHDPRTEAEKARADLMRNAEMGMAVPESPIENRPSVTPETFGEASDRPYVTEDDRARTGTDGVEAGGPGREIGDSTGTDLTSEDRPVRPGEVPPPPLRRGDDEDVLSRAKE